MVKLPFRGPLFVFPRWEQLAFWLRAKVVTSAVPRLSGLSAVTRFAILIGFYGCFC